MTEDEMEQAIEKVMEVADDQAAPERMTQEQALDFYQELGNQCVTRLAAIQEDIGA